MNTKISFKILLNIFICFQLTNIAVISSASDSDKKSKFKTSALIEALNNNYIKIADYIDYYDLIEKIQKLGIQLSPSYEKSVIKYFDSERVQALIKIQTSKPGILKWYFSKITFLRKDLIFGEYEYGEMFGGEILIKVVSSGDKIVNMKTLWNRH